MGEVKRVLFSSPAEGSITTRGSRGYLHYPSSSLKSPSHHSEEQFADKKMRLKLHNKSQGKDQIIHRKQRHNFTCKLQVRSHPRLGPGSRTAGEETGVTVRKIHPPIAADLLLPVRPLCRKTPRVFTQVHITTHYGSPSLVS